MPNYLEQKKNDFIRQQAANKAKAAVGLPTTDPSYTDMLPNSMKPKPEPAYNQFMPDSLKTKPEAPAYNNYLPDNMKQMKAPAMPKAPGFDNYMPDTKNMKAPTMPGMPKAPTGYNDMMNMKAPQMPSAPKMPNMKAPEMPKMKAPAMPTMKAPAMPTMKAPAMPTMKAPAMPQFNQPQVPQWEQPEMQMPKMGNFQKPNIALPTKPEVKIPGARAKVAPLSTFKRRQPMKQQADQVLQEQVSNVLVQPKELPKVKEMPKVVTKVPEVKRPEGQSFGLKPAPLRKPEVKVVKPQMKVPESKNIKMPHYIKPEVEKIIEVKQPDVPKFKKPEIKPMAIPEVKKPVTKVVQPVVEKKPTVIRKPIVKPKIPEVKPEVTFGYKGPTKTDPIMPVMNQSQVQYQPPRQQYQPEPQYYQPEIQQRQEQDYTKECQIFIDEQVDLTVYEEFTEQRHYLLEELREQRYINHKSIETQFKRVHKNLPPFQPEVLSEIEDLPPQYDSPYKRPYQAYAPQTMEPYEPRMNGSGAKFLDDLPQEQNRDFDNFMREKAKGKTDPKKKVMAMPSANRREGTMGTITKPSAPAQKPLVFDLQQPDQVLGGPQDFITKNKAGYSPNTSPRSKKRMGGMPVPKQPQYAF